MYQIFFHSLVKKRDFKKIQKSAIRRILKIIYKKLTKTPEVFGKPLAGDLKGYYRLRIDPYRVIYRIEKQTVVVYIVHIGLRKDLMVYIEAAKRLKLIDA